MAAAEFVECPDCDSTDVKSIRGGLLKCRDCGRVFTEDDVDDAPQPQRSTARNRTRLSERDY